jgi:hypothetical protein
LYERIKSKPARVRCSFLSLIFIQANQASKSSFFCQLRQQADYADSFEEDMIKNEVQG